MKDKIRKVVLFTLCVVFLIFSSASNVSAKKPYSDKAGFPVNLPRVGDLIQITDLSDGSVTEARVAFRKLQKENIGKFKNRDAILYLDWQSDASILYRNGQYFNNNGGKVYIFNTER